MRLFVLLFLFACSSPFTKVQRFPASVYFENKSLTDTFSLFSGPGMPQDLVIAKSLPNAPLKVEILNPSAQIHCVDSVLKTESSTFTLPSNKKGIFASVSCRLDHNGSEYPVTQALNVRFTVILDEYEISNEEYKSKNQLLAYQSTVTNKGAWDSSLTSYVESIVPVKSVDLSSRSLSPQTLVVANSDSYYLSIKGFSGKFKVKSFMGKKDQDVRGDKKSDKAFYSKYNENSVVCGTGVAANTIKSPLIGEGELIDIKTGSEDFNCQFNFRKDDNPSKNEGWVSVQFKSVSYASLKNSISRAISNEDEQIRKRIATYHSNEVSQLQGNNGEIKRTMSNWQSQMNAAVQQVDRDKFTKFKDQTITDLFPPTIKGFVARSTSRVTLNPVKKIVYDEAGNKKSILYLNLTNAISYKIETAEFADKYDRDLPFEEQVNIYLATSDAFASQKPRNFFICNDKIDSFYEALGHVQDEMNDSPLSEQSILDSFKGLIVDSVASCKLGDADKKEIVYTRGSGPTDYFIYWGRKISGTKETLEASRVGNTYYADYQGKQVSYELSRDKKFNHPVFKKGFTLTIDKGTKDALWVEDKASYVERYSEENFIKIGY